MKAFNQVFAALIAVLWLAAGAGVLYMIGADRRIDLQNAHMRALFDLALSGSDRILAMVVTAAAMLPALGLLAFEARLGRRRIPAGHELVAATDDRYRELHQRIDDLQRRVDENSVAAERRPILPGEPVMVPESSNAGPQRRRWSLLSRERG